jgi:hypothetical protein
LRGHDDVYVRDEEGELQFRELGEPTPEDVAQVAAWTHAGLVRVLQRHGRSLDGVSDAADSFATDQPVLASCHVARPPRLHQSPLCTHPAAVLSHAALPRLVQRHRAGHSRDRAEIVPMAALKIAEDETADNAQ